MSILRWPCLFLILIAALAARLWMAAHHPFVFDDSQDYIALARTVIEQRDFQVHGFYAIRMPGYPFFIVPMLFLYHTNYSVLVLQAIMGAFCCAMVYRMGRRASIAIGLLGAALLAIDPLQIAFSAALLSEIPFTFVFLLGLVVTLRLIEHDQTWRWALLGGLWGAAVYLRGSVLWLLVPLGLWVILVKDHERANGPQPETARQRWITAARDACGLLLAFAAMSLALLPWNLRNTARFGSHAWLTTLEGISLYEAVYPEADGGPRQDKIVTPDDLAHLGEAARNDEWNRRAIINIQQDPFRIARLAFVKMARTWSPWLNAADFQNNPAQKGLVAWSVLTDVLALLGLFSRRIPLALRGVILIPILYFTALHAVFLGSVRYRVPVLPLVDLLAAAGMLQLFEWLRRKKPPTVAGEMGPVKQAAMKV